MSRTIVGISVVFDSDFPGMAYRIFCGMVVYIPAAIFCMYRATERSL